MTAYDNTYSGASNATFQGKCFAGLWDVANRVLASEVGFPHASQVGAAGEDLAYAKRVLTDRLSLTGQQLAQQVLRNTTINTAIQTAADGSTVVDADIQFQINENIWSTLRELG